MMSNGYLIPNLTYKSGEQMEQLGKYVFLRRDYLKNYRHSTYQVMLLQDTIGATIYLLFLLRGRRIAVFKSEDIRNEEIYRNKESHAAVWLIDQYTRIVNEVRPIVQKKQKAFDNAMVAIIVGIMMYVVAVLLRKGGF